LPLACLSSIRVLGDGDSNSAAAGFLDGVNQHGRSSDNHLGRLGVMNVVG